MAGSLTQSQRNKIAQILSSGGASVDDESIRVQLAYLGELFTTDHQTDVETELTRWTAKGGTFLKIHPNIANFGAELDAGNDKDDIKNNIATLLQRADWSPISSGSANSFKVGY